jgi:hypothetical protein
LANNDHVIKKKRAAEILWLSLLGTCLCVVKNVNNLKTNQLCAILLLSDSLIIMNDKGINMLKNKALLSKITPQYIIDKSGKKTGVILDILAFEQLLEEIEDIYFGSIAHKALQKDDEYITHTDVKELGTIALYFQ